MCVPMMSLPVSMGVGRSLYFLFCITFELDCHSISCRANIWSLRAPCQVATGRQWNFLGGSRVLASERML
jgi:hypothetical protein